MRRPVDVHGHVQVGWWRRVVSRTVVALDATQTRKTYKQGVTTVAVGGIHLSVIEQRQGSMLGKKLHRLLG